MYTCFLPPEHNLLNLNVHFDRCTDKQPIVVFLDSGKVKDWIDRDNLGSFEPNGARLASINRMLDGRRFELPIVEYAIHDMRIYQGRHRTVALWQRMESAIPFLTMRGMAANLIAAYGAAPIAGQFDLSQVPYPVI